MRQLTKRLICASPYLRGTHSKAIAADATITLLGKEYELDSMTNLSSGIIAKMNRRLYLDPSHPLGITSSLISSYFHPFSFHICNNFFDPVVTVKQNFDELLFPRDHVGRTQHDSYYVNRETVLRTHMTAHEGQLLRQGHKKFLMIGDVYRRDEIDSKHYPVFHQIEGVRVFNKDEIPTIKDKLSLNPSDIQLEHDKEDVERIAYQLQSTLNSLMQKLFGPSLQTRWLPTYFPFTRPSFELEILYNGCWVEVLGCGILQKQFLAASTNSSAGDEIAWAFGLGLERLAMILFDINDIRIFWSADPRFTTQFTGGTVKTFVPFSKYPHISRDISFWLPVSSRDKDVFEPNGWFEMVRGIAGDLIERVELVDEYLDPLSGSMSRCYRIVYRAIDRSLTTEEINDLQDMIRRETRSYGLILR